MEQAAIFSAQFLAWIRSQAASAQWQMVTINTSAFCIVTIVDAALTATFGIGQLIAGAIVQTASACWGARARHNGAVSRIALIGAPSRRANSSRQLGAITIRQATGAKHWLGTVGRSAIDAITRIVAAKVSTRGLCAIDALSRGQAAGPQRLVITGLCHAGGIIALVDALQVVTLALCDLSTGAIIKAASPDDGHALHTITALVLDPIVGATSGFTVKLGKLATLTAR
jgi:hypothetical protein